MPSDAQAQLNKTPRARRKTFIGTDTDRGDIYIGLEISRDEVERAIPEDSGRNGPAEFKVFLATEPKTGVYGTKLMNLLDQGSVLGFNESGTGYLVGTVPQLLEAGTEPLDIGEGEYRLGTQSGWRTAGVDVPTAEEVEAASAPTPKKEKEVHKCICGCGQDTYSNFAMGHDSKLRGLIGRVHDGKEPEKNIPKDAYKILGVCSVDGCGMPDLGHHRHKANPKPEPKEKEATPT